MRALIAVKLSCALVLIGVLLPADTAWALRCKGKIIDNQDSASSIERLCGEPDLRDEWINHYGRLVQQQWYYNFGPRRLLHILTLRQGRLVKMETDGHGFIDKPQAPCRPHEITDGMNKLMLLHLCGEPEQIEAYSGFSRHNHFDPHDHHAPAFWIKREKWFYNFGPRHLRRTVILENGRVQHIQTEGYGD